MSTTVSGVKKLNSGRTLAYDLVLQLSNMNGDVLPDGRHKILSSALRPKPATPPPTEAEEAKLLAAALAPYRVEGLSDHWILP